MASAESADAWHSGLEQQSQQQQQQQLHWQQQHWQQQQQGELHDEPAPAPEEEEEGGSATLQLTVELRATRAVRARHAADLPVRCVRVKAARRAALGADGGGKRLAEDPAAQGAACVAAAAVAAAAADQLEQLEQAEVFQQQQQQQQQHSSPQQPRGSSGAGAVASSSLAADAAAAALAAADEARRQHPQQHHQHYQQQQGQQRDELSACAPAGAPGAAPRKRAAADRDIIYPADDPSERVRYVGSANKAGKPHGSGLLMWRNGARYQGSFQNDALTGYGVYDWPPSVGKRYLGEWLNGKAEGFGKLTSGSGQAGNRIEYSGAWQDGLMHGAGKLQFENGDTYEGHWAYNNKQGQGVLRFKGGLVYDGAFASNQMHGKGTLSWPSGRRVEVTMQQHLAHECWALSWLLWAAFLLLSVLYVLHLMVIEDLSRASREPWSAAKYALTFFVVALSLPMTLVNNALWLILRSLFGATAAPDEPAATSAAAPAAAASAAAAAANELLFYLDDDAASADAEAAAEAGAAALAGAAATRAPAQGMIEWLLAVLRHDLALPQFRVLLLVSMQASLREMFANIIFNVACRYTAALGSPAFLSDTTVWRQGLAVGCSAVLASSCVHIVVYAILV
jgi:hypothetical protein